MPTGAAPLLRGQVFRGSLARGEGLVTTAALRGPRFRRVIRDVYAAADVPSSHLVAIHAAALVMPSQAVVAGTSAAWLYGAENMLDERSAVELMVSREAKFGRYRGLRIHVVQDLTAADIVERDGIRRTTKSRTVLDIARFTPSVSEAVVWMDHLLHLAVVTQADLDEVLSSIRSGRGSAQAVAALGLVDGRAESPQESRLRVGLVTRGITNFTPQYEVTHAGRFVARVDLGDPVRRLAIEYDGAHHDEVGQAALDAVRIAALRSAGWTVIVVKAEDLRDMDHLARRIRAAL